VLLCRSAEFCCALCSSWVSRARLGSSSVAVVLSAPVPHPKNVAGSDISRRVWFSRLQQGCCVYPLPSRPVCFVPLCVLDSPLPVRDLWVIIYDKWFRPLSVVRSYSVAPSRRAALGASPSRCSVWGSPSARRRIENKQSQILAMKCGFLPQKKVGSSRVFV